MSLELERENQVFVSYSRQDYESVGRFQALMQEAGLSVWLDQDGIEPTQHWLDVIKAAILDSPIVLFFWSRSSIVSEMCMQELQVAKSLNRIIVVIRLDHSASVNASELLETSALVDWELALGEKVIIWRLLSLIRNEAMFLNRIQGIIAYAEKWRNHGFEESRLLSGELLLEGIQLVSEIGRRGFTVSDNLLSFVFKSEQSQDEQKRKQEKARNTRRLAYGIVFSIAISCFFISSQFRDKSEESLAYAIDSKSEAASMVEFLLGDLSSALQSGGAFGVMDEAIDRAESYFTGMDFDRFDAGDFNSYSRLGHLLGEIKIRQNRAEEATAILEKNLEIDYLAIERYPNNKDFEWNLAFTKFWLGDVKDQIHGGMAAQPYYKEFYQITKENRHLSHDWNYEYSNAIYNLLYSSINIDADENVDIYFNEIGQYFDSLNEISEENYSFFLDVHALYFRFLIRNGQYQKVIDLSEALEIRTVKGDYYHNGYVALLYLRIADSLFAMGYTDSAKEAYNKSDKLASEINRFDDSTNYERSLIVLIKARLRLCMKLKGQSEANGEFSDFLDGLTPDLSSHSGCLYEITCRVADLEFRPDDDEILPDRFAEMVGLFELMKASGFLWNDERGIFSEFFFNIFMKASLNGDAALLRESFMALKGLIIDVEFTRSLSRPLTAYSVATSFLNDESEFTQRVNDFLDQNSSHDAFFTQILKLYEE